MHPIAEDSEDQHRTMVAPSSVVLPLGACLLLVLVLGASADVNSNSVKTATGGKDDEPRFLDQPKPHLCSSRPKQFFLRGHHYYFSGNVTQYKNTQVDWLDGRNICRHYCMDLVSFEHRDEFELIARKMQEGDVPYIWTSGRLCDFTGCEGREDLRPLRQKGWFWSANRVKMAPTNQIPPNWGFQPWSHTGNFGEKQPDNAEFRINQTPESCMAVLNNVYGDGIGFHDIACYHKKPFFCEDSEELLDYVSSTNPGIKL